MESETKQNLLQLFSRKRPCVTRRGVHLLLHGSTFLLVGLGHAANSRTYVTKFLKFDILRVPCTVFVGVLLPCLKTEGFRTEAFLPQTGAQVL